MRQLTTIAAVLFIFSACNNAPEATASEPQTKKLTPAPPPKSDRFAFWAKSVKITKPMVINQNDVQSGGEGGMPTVSISYTFEFIDSMGNVKEWWMYAEFLKSKPAKSKVEEFEAYKKDLEDFREAQKLYQEITKTPEGQLLIEGNFEGVESIKKKFHQNTRTGSAPKQDIVQLWTRW